MYPLIVYGSDLDHLYRTDGELPGVTGNGLRDTTTYQGVCVRYVSSLIPNDANFEVDKRSLHVQREESTEHGV